MHKIHVILGTKAQLIKMAPILAEFQRRGLPFNFILTGQHKETLDALRENFGIKAPDCVLYDGPGYYRYLEDDHLALPVDGEDVMAPAQDLRRAPWTPVMW